MRAVCLLFLIAILNPDISGSMAVTTEVQGTFKLKGGGNKNAFDIPEL